MKTLRTLSNTLLLLWVAAIAYSVLHAWAFCLGAALALIYLFAYALCRAAALADKELQ